MFESCSLLTSLPCVNYVKYVVFIYKLPQIFALCSKLCLLRDELTIRQIWAGSGRSETENTKKKKSREMGIKLGSCERNHNLFNLQHTEQNMRESAAFRLLGLRVRIPLAARMFASCDCCMLYR
jgi:hypothetical protein